MHPHKNLEIFIIPLSGAIEHRDSLGNYTIVTPGEVQKMSAGAGILHSQMNVSDTSVDRHLQIWIRPQTLDTKPYIEQRRFDPDDRMGRWHAIITPDGRNDSLQVNQDASVYAITLRRDQRAIADYEVTRSIYLHVVEGSLIVASPSQQVLELSGGDAIAFRHGADVILQATHDSTEVLLFNLPRLDGAA